AAQPERKTGFCTVKRCCFGAFSSGGGGSSTTGAFTGSWPPPSVNPSTGPVSPASASSPSASAGCSSGMLLGGPESCLAAAGRGVDLERELGELHGDLFHFRQHRARRRGDHREPRREAAVDEERDAERHRASLLAALVVAGAILKVFEHDPCVARLWTQLWGP